MHANDPYRQRRQNFLALFLTALGLLFFLTVLVFLSGGFFLYVEDCDAVYHRAIEAGAESLMAPADRPHGDRISGVVDPFGQQWFPSTHIKDLRP